MGVISWTFPGDFSSADFSGQIPCLVILIHGTYAVHELVICYCTQATELYRLDFIYNWI
jgi:hypothetical protein